MRSMHACAVIAVACALWQAGPSLRAEVPAAASSPDEAIVDRFLQSDMPALKSYRAKRRLEASTRGVRMRAALDAWTYIDDGGRFTFEVIHEEGSDRKSTRLNSSHVSESRMPSSA